MSLERAARLAGYKAGTDIAGRLAVFAILVLAANRLPTAEFGLVAVATTLGWLGSAASDFGLQLYLSREISRAPSQAGALFWPLFRLRVLTGTLAVLAAAIACRVVAPEAWASCVLIAAAPIITSIAELPFYGFRALDRIDLEATLLLGQRLLALILAAAVMAVAPSLWTLGAALAFASATALAVAIATAGRVMPLRRGDTPIPLTWFRWQTHVAPIGIGILLSIAYFRVDVFLLERWVGLDQVALYSAVFRLVDAVRLIPAAIVGVALPRLFGAGDSRFAGRLSIGLFAGGVVIAAAGYLAAPVIVNLAYDDRYAAAVPIFRILLLAVPLLALNYSLTHRVIGQQEQRRYAWTCGLALVSNVALNAWLIPAHAGAGAAWATIGTELVVTLSCLAVLSARRRGDRFSLPGGQSPAN